jgi:hypothetical protein
MIGFIHNSRVNRHTPAARRPLRTVRPSALLGAVLLGLGLALSARSAAPIAAQTAPIVLVAGWNNIGYTGPAEPVPAALAPIAGQYDALWRFDAPSQTWLGYNPKAPETSDFTDITQGAAYWIHMLQPAVLPVGLAGVAPIGVPTLSTGWNNIVQSGPSAPVRDALAIYNASYVVVWHWNAATQSWQMYDPSSPTASDFQTLTQGQAYFVSVTAGTPNSAAAPTCYNFDSYQPQIAEVQDVLTRAGTNALTSDPSFRLADVHTSPTGGPQTIPGYVPPTVLKAIGWIESNWHQATYAVARGGHGKTITSSQCAYGLLQILTGMQINGTPTSRQNSIGSDFMMNAAAGAQILIAKWNMAPDKLPVFGRRDPNIIEDWYFAIWAYHCFGDMCLKYGVHNNPDDPALKWPRPVFGSPEEQSPSSPFTIADYPYQELIFGRIAYPPTQDGVLLWQPIAVVLPPHGSVGFPVPQNVNEVSAHLEGGQALPVPAPSPSPGPAPTGTPGPH